ncbi:MAG: hypothetical protein ACOZEN_08440 [Thermodesulfobacteriota bacterium]
MDTILVREAMTTLENLTAVEAGVTLMEAATALKACNLKNPGPALLRVRDGSGGTAGVVGMVDVIRGLEPKYQGSGLFDGMREKGFPEKLLEMFVANHGAEHTSIATLVRRASSCTIGEVLRPPFGDETIEGGASIGVALDTLVLRRREYLLVMDGERVAGVVDAFLIMDAALKRDGRPGSD